MQTQNNNNNVTHCKVQCGNEFRRFLLPSSQYADLSRQIQKLFGFQDEDKFLLKYTDEEGDMVTISSDEELYFAITLFRGGLLRLTVETQKCKRGERRCGKWENKEHCGEGFRTKWEEKLKNNPQLLEKKKAALQGKINSIREKKQFLEAKNPGNPSVPHRIAHLQGRLQKLETFLNHLQTMSGNPQVPGSAPAPVIPEVPIQPPIEPKDIHTQIFEKKQQIQKVKESMRSGELQKPEAAEKILAIKEEIWALRDEKRAKMAAVKQARQEAAQLKRKDTV